MTLYSKAKTYYDQKQYDLAFAWADKAIKECDYCNQYHFHLLCRASRKTAEDTKGKIKYALKMIRVRIDQGLLEENDFINDISWCLYDYYVKDYDESCDYDLIEKTRYIIEKCVQSEKNENPLVFTIFRIVKHLKCQNNVNYGLIIKFLERIDYKKLSSIDVFTFLDEKNKERELASKRERYYQDLSKAYEKVEQYKECCDLCNIALNDNIEWHYKNDLWLLTRKKYCECFLTDDFNSRIEEYKEIADKNRFWYMYHKVSSLFFKHNMIEDALVYACLAFDTTQDLEKEVNVMFDLGLLFEAFNMNQEAKLFFQCCAYYRELNGWFINSDLKYKQEYYDFDISLKPNASELKDIVIKVLISKTNKNIGQIIKIDSDRGFGYIKCKDKGDLYFKTKRIMNKKHFLSRGTYVEFDIDQFEGRENAINIKMI